MHLVYSIWFAIQLVLGCQLLTPPTTHLSACHKNTCCQLSCPTTGQPSRDWATSDTQARIQSLTMPPDRVSGKPHHARAPQSDIFSCADDTKLGRLANMVKTFQSS